MEDYNRNQNPAPNFNERGTNGSEPDYNPNLGGNYPPTYNRNYDYGNYDPGYYGDPGPDKSVKGLKIVIIVMAAILAALSVIYFLQVKQLKEDFAYERDTLTSQLTTLMNDYDTLKTMNDTLSVNYEIERQKADSLLQSLQQERRISYRKIKEYEKKIGYMRNVMEGYIRQIDSLNTINRKLVNENSSIRKQLTSYRLRAETAEEKSQELSTRVRQGAVIRARDIRLLALSKSDREVSRANRAERLRVDLVLVGNELATPGERNVYVQIIGPDGYVLANASNALFDYEGDRIPYSATRSVDYQNEDLSVSLFYNGSGITSGKYRVTIYADGHLIGSNEISLR
ncbi:hypothetical protein [uncultured Alistipes sp.]|uniref:hypothetical protein n=1 Tax=uncultured Alistipes sp. TaxID=538949 RepID=UPI00261C24E2|nr:hypothetical protein [uncultured Alistipes sp.]